MTQTPSQLLDKIEAKIPRVQSQLDGLLGVLATGEITRRGQKMPLSVDGQKVGIMVNFGC